MRILITYWIFPHKAHVGRDRHGVTIAKRSMHRKHERRVDAPKHRAHEDTARNCARYSTRGTTVS